MDVKYLTTVDLAERFRTKPESCRYWRHIGYGPKSIKVGRRVLYALVDVEAFESQLRSTAGQPAA